jgi:hypothetical protein
MDEDALGHMTRDEDALDGLRAITRAYVRYDGGWFGGPRKGRDGDEFSAVVAEADGFGFCEVQQELRGSEPKSRGIGSNTTITVRGERRPAGWIQSLDDRSVESLIVEHNHGYIMWNGRVEWYPVRSPSLGGGFSTSDHKTWVCPTDGWTAWEPPASSVAQLQQQ